MLPITCRSLNLLLEIWHALLIEPPTFKLFLTISLVTKFLTESCDSCPPTAKNPLLIDMETGEELRLNPANLQQAYREKAAAYKQELLLRCGQYQIEFVEADISKGLEQVLLPYFLKRSKLY